jgi:hypothetical protein
MDDDEQREKKGELRHRKRMAISCLWMLSFKKEEEEADVSLRQEEPVIHILT